MRKFFKLLGTLTSVCLLAFLSINTYNAANYFFELQKEPADLLAAIKEECAGVIAAREGNRAPYEEDAKFTCGEKTLSIDLSRNYASWSWTDKGDRWFSVIYVLIEKDVSSHYQTAINLWQQTEHYQKEVAVIANNYYDEKLLDTDLKLISINKASRFLVGGKEQSFRKIVGKCRNAINKNNVFCKDLFKESPIHYTPVYSSMYKSK